jgi:hypothetical protein
MDSFTMALPRSLISLTKSHKKGDVCVCVCVCGGGVLNFWSDSKNIYIGALNTLL